jgi:voltage-gated potassium channel
MSKTSAAFEAFLKGRFSVLLIALAVLLLVTPLVPGDQGFIDKLFGIFILVVMTSCLRAISRSRRLFRFMLFLAGINLVAGLYEIYSDSVLQGFETLLLLVRMIYCIIVFFSIISYVLDNTSVTGDKICGAVSAYMIMGITWSLIYTLFYEMDQGSFKVPAHLLSAETVNSTWTFYFSFTTLTTLGYGDITPVTPGAQSYAIMEAVTGQMFVAVIIARLIALHITHRKSEGEAGSR